ncbi:MAG: twin-arginine translocase subunit TatC [Candidatus Hydrogenedentota bacterium]
MYSEEARMTFTEHLGELRTRLIRSAVALFVGFLVCYAVSDYIFAAVSMPLRPLQDEDLVELVTPEAASGDTEQAAPDEPPANSEQAAPEWTALNPLEPFLVRLKLAAYGALILGLPLVLYQLCAFVFPGLRPREQQAVRILIAGGSVLGLAGVAIAYFLIFPLVLPYLMDWAPEGVNIQLRMNETVSLILKGLLGFAIAFQFPMVVLVLVYMDLLSPETLKQYRKIAIVVMTVASAFLTPPEPISMFIMVIPLFLLYEGSIWISYLVVRRRRAGDDASSDAGGPGS